MRDFIRHYIQDALTLIKTFGNSTLEHWKAQKADFFTRTWGRNEYLVIFALAFTCGLAIKALSVHTVTIGYEDYKITSLQSASKEGVLKEAPLNGPQCQE